MTNTATTTSVWKAVCTIVGDESAPFDEHASLFDMGLDSLGLAELVIQLEEQYGEGAITIDDVLANPIVSEIAACLGGGVTGSGPGPVTITAPAPNAEPPKPPKPLTPTAAGIGWSPLTAKAAKALTTPASSAKSVDGREVSAVAALSKGICICIAAPRAKGRDDPSSCVAGCSTKAEMVSRDRRATIMLRILPGGPECVRRDVRSRRRERERRTTRDRIGDQSLGCVFSGPT